MFYDPYSRYSSEYERQQLNILRAARGITPPIPPPRRAVDFVETWIWMCIIGGAATLVFVGSTVLLFGNEQDDWWRVVIVFWLTWKTFAGGWRRRFAALDREYERTLEAWRRAGCP